MAGEISSHRREARPYPCPHCGFWIEYKVNMCPKCRHLVLGRSPWLYPAFSILVLGGLAALYWWADVGMGWWLTYAAIAGGWFVHYIVIRCRSRRVDREALYHDGRDGRDESEPAE